MAQWRGQRSEAGVAGEGEERGPCVTVSRLASLQFHSWMDAMRTRQQTLLMSQTKGGIEAHFAQSLVTHSPEGRSEGALR